MHTDFATRHHPWSFRNNNPTLLFTDNELLDDAGFVAAILPKQFYADQVYPAELQGELALRRAVLEDALRCYYRQFVKKTRPALQAAKEAQDWFFIDDNDWPYSFLNICAALQLEPSYIRRGLRHWQQQPEAVSYRPRQLVSRKQSLKLAA